MASRAVTFYSDGYRLAGLVHLPEDYVEGERRPAVLVCHGRLAIKEWVPSKWIPYLLEAGFVAFSFDYRNLGESEGTLGKLIPQEEVRDVGNAVTFVQQLPEVDPDRIGLLGWGLGGGVVVSAAARDERVKAVVCASGVADGESYGRNNITDEEWTTRLREIADDRVRRVVTGESSKIDMKIADPHRQNPGEDDSTDYGWRSSLITVVGEERASDPEKLGIPTHLTLESMEALYAFKPIDEVDQIAPRPLLIIHAVDDANFPYSDMEAMHRRAGGSSELIGIPDTEHLKWIDPQFPEQAIYVPKVVEWLRSTVA